MRRGSGAILAAALLTSLSVVSTARADPVIAAAGDIACGAGSSEVCAQQATANVIAGIAPTAVVPLGDNQYENGSLSDYQQYYGPSWGKFRAITRPVVGNHEYGTANAAGYFDYFNGVGAVTGPAGPRGKGYYSFDLGGWHVVALNSNCSAVGGCSAGSPEETWLRNDLATHPARCTLAVMHHPRWSSDSWGAQTTEVGPLVQALYDGHTDLMLSGHAHTYERFGRQNPSGAADQTKGLTEIIAGTGGYSEFDFLTPKANSIVHALAVGVLKLTLHPTTYDLQFIPTAGSSFKDTGSGVCLGRGTPPPTTPSASTLPASGVTRSSATLNGSVNANGGSTTYQFQYGRTTSYGASSPATSIGSGTTPVSVRRGLSGLSRDTTYHYRVVARSASGQSSTGGDRTFRTLKH
jgi:Calcineurin-like phosphoesterase